MRRYAVSAARKQISGAGHRGVAKRKEGDAGRGVVGAADQRDVARWRAGAGGGSDINGDVDRLAVSDGSRRQSGQLGGGWIEADGSPLVHQVRGVHRAKPGSPVIPSGGGPGGRSQVLRVYQDAETAGRGIAAVGR